MANVNILENGKLFTKTPVVYFELLKFLNAPIDSLFGCFFCTK